MNTICVTLLLLLLVVRGNLLYKDVINKLLFGYIIQVSICAGTTPMADEADTGAATEEGVDITVAVDTEVSESHSLKKLQSCD